LEKFTKRTAIIAFKEILKSRKKNGKVDSNLRKAHLWDKFVLESIEKGLFPKNANKWKNIYR